MGFPVFRLRTQLRIARGLFDLIARVIYPDLDFDYADCCDVTHDKFKAGHILEGLIAENFPDVKRPPRGNFSPFFLDTQGSRV